MTGTIFSGVAGLGESPDSGMIFQTGKVVISALNLNNRTIPSENKVWVVGGLTQT
jgi:hypothetical protein